jgi:hypothetical protein
MAKSLRESRPLKLAEADAATADGTIPVILIDKGWGSSGYYSEAVLKNAARAGVFAEGTQMFLDHPGEAEMYDRPERSVRDLVATVQTTGVWDESAQGVRANIKPMGANAIMLEDKDFLKAIGLSIRAYGEATIGEAEGRKGQILTELTECISVDFVTKAGRGGRVLTDLMESARPAQVNERAQLHGVSEATANNTRVALQAALTSEYGGDRAWVWVRDFDEANVWFQYETEQSSGVYQLGYSLDGEGTATVSGDPVEVRAETNYIPLPVPQASTESSATQADPQLPAPAGESTATQTEESNMAQIEDKELQELRESADQRAAAEQRAALAESRLAERDARDEARTIIGEECEAAGISFSPLETDGLLSRVRLGESNSFDGSAFRESVKKAAEGKVKESADTPTRGLLSGFGIAVDAGTEADLKSIQAAEAAAAGAFGRKIGA